ncbi:MAG: metallophosphatase [Flavobacteriales bacterium]|nr:metallophosphatase [Flavobacteriales bacterium]|tara:strand:- start:3347 stop:4594 length:1248 start_codon:yes stop_codon:yes gene_type:complete
MNKIFFVIIMLLIFILIEWYAFQAFRELTSKSSAGVQNWVKIIYWSYTSLVLLSFLFYHFGNPELFGKHGRTFILSFIFTNYLFKSILSVFLLVTDLMRGAQWLAWKLAGPDIKVGENGISRSKFITSLGVVVAAAPVISMVWGIVNGAHNYRIRKVKLPIKDLPNSLEGLKIIQLSDIHSGSFWSKDGVRQGIEMIKAEAADLIVFTGDLVNNKASEMDNWKELFAELEAPLGIYSTLGNHDYGDYVSWETEDDKKKNLEDLMQVHADMGWQLLNNENRRIEFKDSAINVLGIENWSAKGRFPKYGDLDLASRGVEKELPTILLSHDPSHWRAEVLKKYPWIDVTLSGHTHGMQFGVEIPGFKWSPVQYFYEEWAGLYREGVQNLYVNRGFGYIGYPGRFGILPEISLFELSRA